MSNIENYNKKNNNNRKIFISGKKYIVVASQKNRINTLNKNVISDKSHNYSKKQIKHTKNQMYSYKRSTFFRQRSYIRSSISIISLIIFISFFAIVASGLQLETIQVFVGDDVYFYKRVKPNSANNVGGFALMIVEQVLTAIGSAGDAFKATLIGDGGFIGAGIIQGLADIITLGAFIFETSVGSIRELVFALVPDVLTSEISVFWEGLKGSFFGIIKRFFGG